jgi:hypothetical protein
MVTPQVVGLIGIRRLKTAGRPEIESPTARDGDTAVGREAYRGSKVRYRGNKVGNVVRYMAVMLGAAR